MALIELGGLALDGFEVPAFVGFGGAQRTAVHQLLGGGRVIDSMGRDDSALVWSGIFSGEDAGDRARAFDAMRAAGNILALNWDAFCYNVIIGQLRLEYCNPWWIPYQIECVVLSDLAQSAPVRDPTVADGILADLTAASPFVDIGNILSGLSMPGALLPGAVGLANAHSSLTIAGTQIQSGIAISENGLGANDIPAIVSAAQALAQLSSVQGYVGRSLVNLQGLLN